MNNFCLRCSIDHPYSRRSAERVQLCVGFVKKQKRREVCPLGNIFRSPYESELSTATLKCEPDSVLCTERVHLQVGSTNAKSTPKGAFLKCIGGTDGS